MQGYVAVIDVEDGKETFNAFGEVAFCIIKHLAHQPHPLIDRPADYDVNSLTAMDSHDRPLLK